MEMKLLHIITEDVRYTVDKAKSLLEKYTKELNQHIDKSKLIYNKFDSLVIGDLLEPSGVQNLKKLETVVQKYYQLIEKIYYDIDDIRSNMYDEYDDNDNREAWQIYKETEDIEDKYKDLEYHLEYLKEAIEKITELFEDIQDNPNKIKFINIFKKGNELK